MKIAISGITGLVGRALSDHLLSTGYSITGIVRNDFKHGAAHLANKLEGIDVVVNLAGAPILKRWTSDWKEEIRSSREDTTSLLVSAMNDMPHPPGVFISASAVGIYDTFEVHDEYSTAYADDFLADVCTAWERSALNINSEKTRLSIIRLGVVLSLNGGALKKMLLPFSLGLGGKIGDGLQSMPFIHIDDLVRGIEWIIENENNSGIFNMVAPQMISNVEFTKALASELHRPAFLTIPERGLKLIYGEASQTLTKGQKVVPKRLMEKGFEFKYPDISSALRGLLKN